MRKLFQFKSIGLKLMAFLLLISSILLSSLLRAQPVINCNLKAKIDYKTSNLLLKAKAVGNGYYYSWDFGDGTSATGKRVSHTYASSGSYKVCMLTVSKNKLCSLTTCDWVKIERKCTLEAKMAMVVDGFTVKLVGKTNEKASLVWKLSDGTVLRGDEVKHMFKSPGVYDVCLVATSNYDKACTYTTCQKVVIKRPCDLDLNAWYKIDCRTGKVQFKAETGEAGETAYQWNIDNGTQLSGVAPTTQLAAGTYHVCLLAKNYRTKCKDSFCFNITVCSCNDCKLDPNFRYIINCKDGYIKFYGIENTANEYEWTVNGSTIADTKDAVYYFKSDGKIEVCFYVWDTVNNCKANVCKTIEIDCNPCKLEPKFRYKVDCAKGVMHLYGIVNGAQTFAWKVNGVSAGYNQNVSYSFKQDGLYSICFTAYDSVSDCKETICDTIEVDCDTCNLNPSFTYKFNCEDGYVKFYGNADGGNLYNWTVNGTYIGNGVDAVYYFKTNGTIEVCYTVKNSKTNCKTKYCQKVKIDCKTASVNPLENGGLNIFPNPSTGVVNIENALNSRVDCKIYTMQGKLVAQNSVDEHKTLTTSLLANGAYVVEAQTIDGIFKQIIIIEK